VDGGSQLAAAAMKAKILTVLVGVVAAKDKKFPTRGGSRPALAACLDTWPAHDNGTSACPRGPSSVSFKNF
jgi:hypothetical protein